MKLSFRNIFFIFVITTFAFCDAAATEFSEHSFLIAEYNSPNLNNLQFWSFLKSNNFSGIEAEVEQSKKGIQIINANQDFNGFLENLLELMVADSSKIVPVFISYQGNISILDSMINASPLSSYIFYLPRGETWPTMEYLIQANRRIIFFVRGDYQKRSNIMHEAGNYVLKIKADEIAGQTVTNNSRSINLELLMVDEFDKLPTQNPGQMSKNMLPDYINFLLEVWTKYGKKPNFIFVGRDIRQFEFIIEQLKSFAWINGNVKVGDKTMEKVYWKNPDVAITGGKFSFPYRGGEEITLSPFAPGYRMMPEHIVVTGEMDIPESYTIIAMPLQLDDDLTGSFNFEGVILNDANPPTGYKGENFSFSQDIERGKVLKLPENASVNLGPPESFGLRNSSFTVSCFVKFTEILEYGDNAILGNYESGYRRGLHLILRSGHPYFGLWSNDFMSEVKLDPNIWYHLAWRYILETGEQAIFLNGKNIGSSDGHPPFSGTGDIHLGSALSQGASLRGYIDNLYIWNRPLGNEEINRLALDEQIRLENKQVKEKENSLLRVSVKIALAMLVLIVFVVASVLVFRKIRIRKQPAGIVLPPVNSGNQIQLFNKFIAIDRNRNDITQQFTPKIKELFLYTLLYTLKSGAGAPVSDIDKNLWGGLPPKKIANNRAVTLNKLRKILTQIDGLEVVTQNGFLLTKTEEPFFCDFVEAYQLSQSPGGMNKQQLETFFSDGKKGSFFKRLLLVVAR